MPILVALGLLATIASGIALWVANYQLHQADLQRGLQNFLSAQVQAGAMTPEEAAEEWRKIIEGQNKGGLAHELGDAAKFAVLGAVGYLLVRDVLKRRSA